MKRTTLDLPIALAALLAVSACDKTDKATTPPTEDTGETSTDTMDKSAPQEPDPPVIAEGAHEYLVGHYEKTIELLEPAYQELRDKNQLRASGLAAGWLALAHAQIVFENAEAPSNHAMAMADETNDPEVMAVAKASHGAFLLGNEDYEAAQQAFTDAAKAAPGTLPGAIAQLLRAESLIGEAFGTAASDDVEDPQALEDAKAAYAEAAKVAEAGLETDVIMGRVEEGYAAIAKYQNNKAGICEHALAATKHFQAAGVSDFLAHGAQTYVAEYDCK